MSVLRHGKYKNRNALIFLLNEMLKREFITQEAIDTLDFDMVEEEEIKEDDRCVYFRRIVKWEANNSYDKRDYAATAKFPHAGRSQHRLKTLLNDMKKNRYRIYSILLRLSDV